MIFPMRVGILYSNVAKLPLVTKEDILSYLEGFPISIEFFQSEEEVIQWLKTQPIHILLTQFPKPNQVAKDFIQRISQVSPHTKVWNRISSCEIPASMFFQLGYHGFWDDQDLNSIPFLIQEEQQRLQEKKEREILSKELDASLNELQFQKFAMDQSAIISVSNHSGNITYVNDKFCELTGYTKEEVIGKNHNILNSGYHSSEFWKCFYEALNSGKVWRGEICNKKKNGSKIWFDVTVVPFFDNSGKINKYIAIQFDITKRVLAEERLTHDAFYDPATNLPNRNFFLAKIEEKIGNHIHNPEFLIWLIIINIRQFNRVNNIYGYNFGDIVIQEFANKLKEFTNQYGFTLGRLSGDSFGILAAKQNLNDQSIIEFIESFHMEFQKPYHIQDKFIYLEFAVGVGKLGQAGKDAETLLRNTELAMFENKKNLSLSYCLFEEQMRIQLKKKSLLIAKIKKAIQLNEFSPYYQPLFHCPEAELAGFEVLLRWESTKGIIPPGEFLNIAEESGYIHEISEQVLRKAFLEFQTIQKKFFESSRFFKNTLFLSINLSPEQFHEETVEFIHELSIKNGIHPNHIHIEITESMAMKDVHKTIQILSHLSQLGYKISLDDFGTGYSSLSHMKHLPIDHIKVDKSFVDGILQGKRELIIFQSIIQLTKHLGLECIIEGVETREQYEKICSTGADFVQGYYFGKPMSFQNCLIWFQEYSKKELNPESISK